VLALFFATDRMDHLITDVMPKLDLGITVISDRYILSSLAYQALESNHEWIRQLNARFQSPDLTILLDTPVEICLKRMQRQRWHVELYEEGSKLERVLKNYLRFARELASAGERVAVVDGANTIELVHRAVADAVRGILKSPRQPALDQLSFESSR
jgi:dTMP kinase